MKTVVFQNQNTKTVLELSFDYSERQFIICLSNYFADVYEQITLTEKDAIDLMNQIRWELGVNNQ